MSGPSYVRTQEAVMREVAGENLLVPVRGALADMECVFATTEVGAYIWSELAEPRTIQAIAERVLDAFDVDDETALRDSRGFVSELERDGLVEVVNA